ncbi:hypothetical protein NQ317_012107 [Molorchus minor]|uniref:Uncharacterized protein n=1 Tax=Molorchus minor TaxID=1323400 RepID=A0ABQ9J166_9CUCU|nr:hypothetical protein NQ317_012107 [Molorchus minor]
MSDNEEIVALLTLCSGCIVIQSVKADFLHSTFRRDKISTSLLWFDIDRVLQWDEPSSTLATENVGVNIVQMLSINKWEHPNYPKKQEMNIQIFHQKMFLRIQKIFKLQDRLLPPIRPNI